MSKCKACNRILGGEYVGRGHLRTMGVGGRRPLGAEIETTASLFDELENYATITQMAYIVTSRGPPYPLVINNLQPVPLEFGYES